MTRRAAPIPQGLECAETNHSAFGAGARRLHRSPWSRPASGRRLTRKRFHPSTHYKRLANPTRTNRSGLISFTKAPLLRHRRSVRSLPFIILVLLLGICSSRAQVQEKKLVDRLLEPDMTLQNSAQDKKFTVSGTSKTKTAPTKSFYVADRPKEKKIQGARNFLTKIFGTRFSRAGDKKASLTTRGKIALPQIRGNASAYASTRSAHTSSETYPVSEYSETKKPFLVQGKSQKSLSQQDSPLTIDQVRELLNKNK